MEAKNKATEKRTLTVLVTGSKGQLGSELRRLSKENKFAFCRFLFADLDVMDICNQVEVRAYFMEHQIDVLVNCAAYTAVDKAEMEADLAYAINRDGVAILANCCKDMDVFMIQISTDYVFDGTNMEPYGEEDIVGPIGVYGLSKRAGEEAMMQQKVNGLIIRTAWLYSSFGHNFVKTMLKLSKERDDVHVVADQYGTPTWAKDLADVILTVLSKIEVKNKKGVEIYHYTNEGECSWYDFAVAIMQLSRARCDVDPIETKDYPTSCKRPAYSVLNKTKIKNDFGLEIPSWHVSLENMLKDLETLSV